jgi:hypothetical protein
MSDSGLLQNEKKDAIERKEFLNLMSNEDITLNAGDYNPFYEITSKAGQEKVRERLTN